MAVMKTWYVQASKHFPGILVDKENRTLRFFRSRNPALQPSFTSDTPDINPQLDRKTTMVSEMNGFFFVLSFAAAVLSKFGGI
jgi:hypothetical protein